MYYIRFNSPIMTVILVLRRMDSKQPPLCLRLPLPLPVPTTTVLDTRATARFPLRYLLPPTALPTYLPVVRFHRTDAGRAPHSATTFTR